jgi:hypothetical protein
MQLPRISRYAFLDKAQANQLHQMIVEVEDLNARDFILTPATEASRADTLVYSPEPNFQAVFTGDRVVIYAPGQSRRLAETGGWDERCNAFRQWLGWVSEWQASWEHQSALRDLWAEQEAEQEADAEVAALSDAPRNDPFDAEEKLIIVQTIGALRDSLQESLSSSERWEDVDSRLRYVEAAGSSDIPERWLTPRTRRLWVTPRKPTSRSWRPTH